jgi:hypothetical protein
MVLTHTIMHKALKLINYFRIHWKNTFSNYSTVTEYFNLGEYKFDEGIQ